MLVGVTGACGFIGVHLVRNLLSMNIEVIGVDNFEDPHSRVRQRLIEKKTKVLEADVLDLNALLKGFKDVDHIVHLAAESHVDSSLNQSLKTVRVNALGTANILEVARQLKIPLTYVSTDEVFGDLPLSGVEKFDTLSGYNPSSPYSASKAAGELFAKAWAKSHDVFMNITNCGNNYGEYQSLMKFIPRTMALISQNEKPVLYSSGKNVRDWIYVGDHANAIIQVVLKGLEGQRYMIGTSDPVSNIDLLQSILSVAGKEKDFFDSVPDRPGHDLRYEINPSPELGQWGWTPEHSSVKGHIGTLWEHYNSRSRIGDLDVSDFRVRGLSG